MVWAAVGVGVLGAATSLYESGQANKTAANAAKGAAWAPFNTQGAAGNVEALTDKNGSLYYQNNGSDVSQLTNAQLSTGANKNLSLFNKLSTSADPSQALSAPVQGALSSANNAFSDVNNPGAFFSPNGQSAFTQLGRQSLGAASAAGDNATTALNGGGTVGTTNALGTQQAGAASNALTALGNFDPAAYAATAKSQLDALAAPGDISATQSLFNHLQGTGRLGLTQNGELGDIGGLALSQSTANNQRALQAAQLGQQQQAQLVSNAGALGAGSNASLGLGSNLTSAALNQSSTANTTAQNSDVFGLNQLLGANNLSQQNALQRFSLASTALGLGNNQIQQQQNYGLNGINAALQENSGDLNAQNSTVNASAVRSGAQSNAGAIAVAGANNAANNAGSLFSGLAPVLGKGLSSLMTPSTPTPQFSQNGGAGGSVGNLVDPNNILGP